MLSYGSAAEEAGSIDAVLSDRRGSSANTRVAWGVSGAADGVPAWAMDYVGAYDQSGALTGWSRYNADNTVTDFSVDNAQGATHGKVSGQSLFDQLTPFAVGAAVAFGVPAALGTFAPAAAAPLDGLSGLPAVDVGSFGPVAGVTAGDGFSLSSVATGLGTVQSGLSTIQTGLALTGAKASSTSPNNALRNGLTSVAGVYSDPATGANLGTFGSTGQIPGTSLTIINPGPAVGGAAAVPAAAPGTDWISIAFMVGLAILGTK